MIIGKGSYLKRSRFISVFQFFSSLKTLWRSPYIYLSHFSKNTPVIYNKEKIEKSCKDCQVCIDHCPTECLFKIENVVHLESLACINCGICAADCPDGLISLKENIDGPGHGEQGFIRALHLDLIGENIVPRDSSTFV